MTDTKTISDNRYRMYLLKKHKQFKTDSRLLSEIVSIATGSKIKSDQRIVQGEVNEVHKIITNFNKTFIVRISRSDNSRFEAEKWAIDNAKKAGVPVPEVLLIEKRTNKDETLTFCVEKQIDGIPLMDYLKLVGAKSKNAHRAIKNAGSTLAKIHSVQTRKYGNLNSEGIGHNTSWQEYMTSWSRKADKLMKPAKHIGLDLEIIKKAIKYIESHNAIYKINPPRLLHGDYGGDHIFVKDETVSGVIDFENCKGGDPAWDFSWWSYYRNNRPPIQWLMDGYTKETVVGNNFELRIKLGELRLGLDMVYYYFHENNEAGQDLAKKRLTKIVLNFNQKH